MNELHREEFRESDHTWWDKHVSLGNIMNLAAVFFLAGGAYFVVEARLDDYDESLEKHAERLTKIEDLQISMAEVVLQQNQFQNQLGRVEERITSRYKELSRRVEGLELSIRQNRIENRDDR